MRARLGLRVRLPALAVRVASGSSAFVAALVLALALASPACSTSGGAGSADASAGALQPLGSPCDVSLDNPCAPAPTACAANVCTAGKCTQLLVSDPSCSDTGALPPPNTLCATNADCDAGVCGFLSGAGCAVTGVCVVPVADASLPLPACGCDGRPDPYVASGFASAPAASASACVDAGGNDAAADGDSGADADAATDAGAVDAGAVDSGDAAEAG